jgi:hypothetical protein
MSGKRPSLAESMRQAVRPEPETPPSSPPAVPAVPLTAAQAATGFHAATRAGKKKMTAVVDPAVHKRLKSLAVELDTTTEALLDEAIADLFTKHGIDRGG